MERQIAIPSLNPKNTLILLSFFLLAYMLLMWLKSKLYFYPDNGVCFLDQIQDNPFYKENSSLFDLSDLEDLKIFKDQSHYIHGWLLKHSPKIQEQQSGGGLSNSIRNLIIVSHGNGGSVLDRNRLIKTLHRHFEVDIFVYDYSGFGSTKTKYWLLSESVLRDDCQKVVQHFLDQGYQKDNIVLYGESLGVPISCYTAYKMGINKLILQSGPASIKDVIDGIFHKSISLILGGLVWGDFSTKNYLKKLKNKNKEVQVYVLHSKMDEVVSYHNAEILEKNGAELITIAGYHNEAIIGEQTWRNLRKKLLKRVDMV